MSEIKLSICIATRNRGAFIGVTLDSIIAQATDEVEIVVLDGASTDNTEAVIADYCGRFPNLRYVRPETNMGFDRDYARAVDLAQGEYCWLFSDDDLLKPGAIKAVLDATKDGYALIIANGEVRDADLSKLLETRRLPIKQNKVYNSGENHLLLSENGDYLTFIGCVIIKRQVWAMRDKESYFGSYFIHVGVIFQHPLPADTLAIAEPLLSIRYGNASWLGKYFEIWMFKWPALIWSFPGLPDSAKRQVCAKEPWRSFKTLLQHRAKGAYTKKEYDQLLKPHLESYWARFVSKTAAYFPGRAANLIAFIYFSIFHRPSARLLIFLDLTNSPFCFWKLPTSRRVPPKLPTPISAESQVPTRQGTGMRNL